jgi:hypothetical protein
MSKEGPNKSTIPERCPDCGHSLRDVTAHDISCPECHYAFDQNPPELPWVWFDETIKDLKDRYDKLAKWERAAERDRDPKLPAILAEDCAHPDVSRLRSLARRLWPSQKFDRETVQAVADEVRN